MKTLLTCNLSTRTANSGGGAWAPPELVYGEEMTLALRFAENRDGAAVEPVLAIVGLTASIGEVDARPASGRWAVQVGAGAQTVANTTASVPHDCSPKELADAINAKTAIVAAHGTVKVRKVDGSWLLTFGAGASAVPVKVVENELAPVSLGRVTAVALDEVWTSEVRLIVMPVAFTDTSEAVLPDPPTMELLLEGGSSSGVEWNTVQALHVPPDFRAAYQLKQGFARSARLTVDDGTEAIQAALEGIVGAGNVKVSDAGNFTAHLEFGGELAGTSVALLEVLPLDPPPGDLTFTIGLGDAPLLAMLRSAETVTLPLEVRLRTEDEEEVESEAVVLRQAVTIRRPVFWPELATVPARDWLRPASPKSYVPFDPGSVLVGQQFARQTVGNGAATVFVFAHGLATEDVFVFARENVSDGRQLVDGTDFSVRIVDADSVEVTALTGAPALNAWVLTVISSQTVGAFAEGLTIEMGQVNGLEARLAAMEAAVAALQALVPTTPLGSTSGSDDGGLVIDIASRSEVWPVRREAAQGVPLIPGALHGAIHDAAVTGFAGALPGSPTVGQVYRNDNATALIMPGGLGLLRSSMGPGEFAGHDGRRWMPLRRAGTTTSYFPRDFERELFSVEINAQMLRAGMTLALDFALELALLGATTRAQMALVIEHGALSSATSPATTQANLAAITWSPTALLRQRLVLADVAVKHRFGVDVVRAANGVLAANQRYMGFVTAAGAVPAAADFALRVRLVDFDTEDSVADAVGAVSLSLTAAQANLR